MPSVSLTTASRPQKTLCQPVSFSGIGIHTGVNVDLSFIPADVGTGIVFERTDLAGKPRIPATVEYVVDTSRSTTLGVGAVKVHTVEHVLSALRAFKIDNLIIQISSFEPPVADGSAKAFVEMIQKSGIVEQNGTVPLLSLPGPVWHSEGDFHLVALPSDDYSISYTLNYPGSEVLKAQFFSTKVTPENYLNEISPCRTFSRYEEISYLIDKGLIKGGSLDNAVVIMPPNGSGEDEAILSKGGLCFPDEMVRHKVLDLIGDLSLVGFEFNAHVIALRSGHKANVALAAKIFQVLTHHHHLGGRHDRSKTL
jgi:UDP-3-O-[3-hydroxymyristoyl] N-acetylglucosamine deacetylase